LVPKEKRTGRNKVAMRRSKEEARERREDFVHSNSVSRLQIKKWGVVVLAAAASFHVIFRGIAGR
jgi:hypothetical protein